MLLKTTLQSLLDNDVLEEVRLPRGDCLRLKAPFQIVFSPSIVEWFQTAIPPGEEVGGFLGGEISRNLSGEVRATLTVVVPVRNTSRQQDREYVPDMRSWTPALRRVFASVPIKLPISFHTHPMEEGNILEATIRHDANLTVSTADMQSYLEIAEEDGARFQIPQLLVARRPYPLRGLFAAIYGSEISRNDLKSHYERIVSPSRIDHYRSIASLARDIWTSKHGRMVALALGTALALGLVLAPEQTLGILMISGASTLLAGHQVSLESIDNKGDADYIGFTSHLGQDAVLAFHVPQYSASDLSGVEELVHKLKSRLDL